jgi:hypothetical protein
MPTFDDYRNIDIDIDGANDWIPEVRLSGGDVEGRTITVRLLKDGKVIDDPTESGSVTLTARLLFNPKVGTAYPGGYKTMSRFVSASMTGEDTWGFEVTVPRAAFTNLTGSHTAMAIEVQKTTGTGSAAKDEIVCSRTFNAIVDESVLKAGDGTDPDPLEEWHNLINHGDGQIQDMVDRGNAAIATFNTNGQHAIDGFNTKGNTAVDAFNTKGDNAVHTFEVNSAKSIVDFNTKSNKAVADFDTSSKAKLDKFDTDSQAAIDGVNTVKNDMQSLVDGANIAAGTVTERKPNEAPTFELTGDKWDKTMNLGLPRGASIASITATTLQAGQQATVTSNKNADGDYNVEVGLPTGPQGVDGFPVFVFTSAISSTVSDYSISKNSGNISPRPDIDTNYANKAFIMDADGSVFLVFRDDNEGLHVNGSQRLLSLKGPAGDTGGVATADKVGVVKPGFGLEVDSAGTLSVSHVAPPAEGDYDVAKIHGNDSTGAGVLIDRTKGLVSSDAGVAVNLSADNPGLEFDAAGGLKATAQTIGDGSHTSKGILQVGDGLNVDNGVVSLETAQGLTVDQTGGKNSVRVKLPSGKGGLMFTSDNELEVRMVEHPSAYASVPLAHTSDGVGVMFDGTKGLTAHDNQLALMPATPANLGGVMYDNTTIKMDDYSKLFAAIGCVSKVQANGTWYPNIAPKPICANPATFIDQSGVWFGFYALSQGISFDQIYLRLRMADGNKFPSNDLSNLASYLTGKRIIVENGNSVAVSSATSDESWGNIYLTLQSNLTVNAGPHWFEVA